jgi:hypothetical protein
VSVGPEHEAPRPEGGDGFSDAVTFAFGDERADLYGVARLGLAGGAASGLVILFHDGDPVVVSAEGGIEVAGSPGSTPRSSSPCTHGDCTTRATRRASISTCARWARSPSSTPPTRRPRRAG